MAKPKTNSRITRGETKGGYPAGDKPVSQIKPPPPAVSRPKKPA